jgi:hypothetical protein
MIATTGGATGGRDRRSSAAPLSVEHYGEPS